MKSSPRAALASALLAAAAAPLASAGDPPHVERGGDGRITRLPAAGMGLADIDYWQTSWVFADAMKAAGVAGDDPHGPWGRGDDSLPWPEIGPDELPTGALAEGQTLFTNVYVHADGHYPAGRWVLAWDGNAELSVSGDARGRSGSGRIELDVREGGQTHDGMIVRIHSNDPADPIRNLRFWTPGNEGAEDPIHPRYGETLEPFSVLRMMDWGRTNLSPLTSWDERPLPGAASYSGPGGVPYEVMVRAANNLGKDLWLCVPHRAVDGDPATEDPYVTKLAQLVRYGADADGEPYASEQADPVFPPLDPELSVWLEYSNETWNRGFSTRKKDRDADPMAGQFTYVEARAEEMGVDEHEANARLSADLFAGFGEAFGQPERLVRVIAGQANAPQRLKGRLAGLPTPGEPGGADVAAIAYYFTPNEMAQAVNAWLFEHNGSFGEEGMDAVFEVLHDHLQGGQPKSWSANAEAAEAYGVPLASYEGNQHLTMWQATMDRNDNPHTEAHPKLEETLVAVCRDDRMHDAYREALSLWVDSGGTTATGFVDVDTWGRSGNWGHKEYQDQPIEEATLYRALTGWVGEHADGFEVNRTRR